MNAPLKFQRAKIERYLRTYDEFKARHEKKLQSDYGFYDDDGMRHGGLIAFVRYFWNILEPETTFVDGWPLWAMCEHLEAVTRGDVTRLLINVPPGFMKSMLTDVFWPAWEWGPMGKPHYRYVAFSYSASLTERDNDRFRILISSERYQRLYGPIKTDALFGQGVGLRNKTTIKVMNTHTGWKLASSVGGVATGERGDRIIIDDPHNVIEAESEVERANAVRWFRESVSTRLNNLDTGAIVVIMQRVHEGDVAGVALGDEFDYCHLMIPWEFDPERNGVLDDDNAPIDNAIDWHDPRADEGEVNAGEAAWADRFSVEAMARTHKEIGPYAWASQFQQSPIPRGEGIFKPDWWRLWADPNNKFPQFDYLVGSLDGAFTEDEENDPSGFTLWGTFSVENKRGVMLIAAWRRHLQFSAKRNDPKPNETYQVWRQRTMASWGLIEWVYDSCTWLYGRPLKVDRLLIEAKASGISAAQEIQNRYGIHDFAVTLCPVKGDKVARALSVQPIFSNRLVWAPEFDWSEMVIREMEVFPKGKHDDLTDSATQALKYLRDGGLLMSDEEISHEDYHRGLLKPRKKAFYPV